MPTTIISNCPAAAQATLKMHHLFDVPTILNKLIAQNHVEKTVDLDLKCTEEGRVRLGRNYSFYSDFKVNDGGSIATAQVEFGGQTLFTLKKNEKLNETEWPIIFPTETDTRKTTFVFPGLHPFHEVIIRFLRSDGTPDPSGKARLRCKAHLLNISVWSDLPRFNWKMVYIDDQSLLIKEGLVGVVDKKTITENENYSITFHQCHGELAPIDSDYLIVSIYHEKVDDIIKELKGIHPSTGELQQPLILTDPPCKDVLIHIGSTEENVRIVKKYGASCHARKRFLDFTPEQTARMAAKNIQASARLQRVADWMAGKIKKYPLESREEIRQRFTAIAAEQRHLEVK